MANDVDSGSELWRLAAPDAGATLLADINQSTDAANQPLSVLTKIQTRI